MLPRLSRCCACLGRTRATNSGFNIATVERIAYYGVAIVTSPECGRSTNSVEYAWQPKATFLVLLSCLSYTVRSEDQ